MSYNGRCSCGNVQFRLNAEPMMTHACHCTQCPRVTGPAFGMHTVLEPAQVEMVAGEPRSAHFEGTSHTAYFCGDCGTYVWSHYAGLEGCWFIRVGTLDEHDSLPPDVHIYTGTKQPWMELHEGVPSVDEFYDLPTFWPPDILARLQATMPAK